MCVTVCVCDCVWNRTGWSALLAGAGLSAADSSFKSLLHIFNMYARLFSNGTADVFDVSPVDISVFENQPLPEDTFAVEL